MKLYIDTTNAEKVTLGLDDQRFQADSKKERAQMILPYIKQVLEENNKTLQDITEIEVNTGPGSFTGIKVGVAVAQSLAWTLGVPLNGKDISKEALDFNYE